MVGAMRAILIALLVGCFSLPLVGDEKKQKLKDYPLRTVPLKSQRFLKVYEEAATQEWETRKRNGGWKFYQQGQKTLRILQHIEGRRYLAEEETRLTSRLKTTTHHRTIAIDLIRDKRLPDGAGLQGPLWKGGIEWESTGKVHEYTSVAGAKKSVLLYSQVPVPKKYQRMELDEFVTRLKDGESFLVKMGTTLEPCKKCNGFGRIPDGKTGNREKRSADRKIDCPDCKGKGKIQSPRVYRIKW
jgi:hypothetical protein